MAFQNKKAAKITAFITGSKNKITVPGITADETSESNAKTQIDKILTIVGKSVQTNGMTLTLTKEVSA